MQISIGLWDVALLIAVSVQSTILAYIPQPKLKAFVLSLPVPFTLASLALGRPIDSTNVLGLIILFVYVQAIRLLHLQLHVPIIPAITLPTVAYAVVASLLAQVLPTTDVAFWLSALVTLTLAVTANRLLPQYNEPAYRTSLPVWIKGPVIIAVVLCLVIVKNALRGFMTAFPMVTIVAAYEARYSLGTIGRQIVVVMMTMTPMMMLLRLTQTHIGLAPSLALGWLLLLGLLLPLSRSAWAKGADIAASPAPPPVRGESAAKDR